MFIFTATLVVVTAEVVIAAPPKVKATDPDGEPLREEISVMAPRDNELLTTGLLKYVAIVPLDMSSANDSTLGGLLSTRICSHTSAKALGS